MVHPFGGAAQLRSADIDTDGDLDLIGVFGGHHLKWFANTDGAGTFSAAISLQTLLGDCDAYILADVDGDTDIDIVLFEQNEDMVRILTNDGSGLFSAWLTLNAPSQPRALACADVNGDGRKDIIVSLWFSVGPGIGIFFGTDGGFSGITSIAGVHQGPTSTMLLVGDLDLLGGLDIVLRGEGDELIVMRNELGDGISWSNDMLNIPLGEPAYSYHDPQILDVDGDGDMDLAESRGPAVHWLRNDLDEGGVLTFTEDVIESWSTSGSGIFSASPCGPWASVVFVPGNPALPVRWNSYLPELGSFAYSNDLPAIPRGQSVLLADINGDGKEDLVMSMNDGISWFANEIGPSTGSLELPVIDTLCVQGGPVTLPDAQPSGGSWYGSQISNGLLFRSNLGVTMDLPIVHAVYEEEGCPLAAATSIRLIQAPVFTTAVPSVLCSADPPIQLTSEPANVAWYGLDGSSVVNPAIWAGGYIVCTYTDATNTSCSFAEGPILRWNTLPAAITPAGPFCSADQQQIITASAAPPFNVTWSGPVNGSTLSSTTFDPSMGAGEYEVVLIVDPYGPNQCGNSDTLHITVNQTPEITFTQAPAYCAESELITLDMASPGGGFWSGPGVNGGFLDPVIAGSGDHLLNYFVQSPEGCGAQSGTTISLVSSASVEGPQGLLCRGDAPATYVGTPAGGIWDAPVGVGGTLDPSGQTIGTYPIIYTYTDPRGCVLLNEDLMVEIGEPKFVGINDVGILCTNTPAFSLEGSASGVWSGSVNGVGPSVSFDPAQFGAGTWPVTLTIASDGECPGSATIDLVVDICAGVSATTTNEPALAPNPFIRFTYLTLPSSEATVINVMDAAGRMVSTHRSTGTDRIALDLQGQNAGAYTVRVITSSATRSLRALKVD